MIPEIDTKTLGDKFHANEASLDKKEQGDPAIIPEEKGLSVSEQNIIEAKFMSENKIFQKEELEEKPQDKGTEVQTEQKSNASSDASENNGNENFKEKITSANDQGREVQKNKATEKCSNVILKDLETTDGTEDKQESKLNKQTTEDNNEECVFKERDMEIAESAFRLQSGNQSNQPTLTTDRSSRDEQVGDSSYLLSSTSYELS